MKLLLTLLMIVVGMLLPFQAGINAEFRRYASHPLWAAVLNFVVGLAAILLAATVMRVPLPSVARMAAAPWWSWLGGFMGATLVVTSIVSAPRLGATLLIACLVAGQLCSSVVVDHFGWAAYPVKPVSAARILGVLFLALGVLLIERSS